MAEEYPESKQERREKKRIAQQEKMKKHGQGLARIYRDAILKRLGLKKPPSKSEP